MDDSSVGARGSYTFENVKENHTIHATFAIDTYTIEATAGSGGSIDPSGNVEVEYDGSQTFTITADEHYHIEDVVVDDSSVGARSRYTFENVKENHTIKASFEAKKGPCFIATAAYDSPLHPHVNILRDFRDAYLMPSKLGRSLVNLYYKYSPFVGNIIAKRKVLKFAVRISLLPIIAFSYSMVHFGPMNTTVLIGVIFILPVFLNLFLRRKQSRLPINR